MDDVVEEACGRSEKRFVYVAEESYETSLWKNNDSDWRDGDNATWFWHKLSEKCGQNI